MSSRNPADSAEYTAINHRETSHLGGYGRWLTELGAWLGSALLLGCIVVVLYVYDNSQSPTLHWGLTLNALVSIILKVGVGLLTVPLAAAMGQWKWVRVRDIRLLSEFAAISDAAQSPFSSCKSLVRLDGGIVAAAGAILIISIQGIDTFVHESITYGISPTRIEPIATLPLSDYFRSQAVTDSDASTPPDFGMKAAIYNGLFSGKPNATYPVTPSCAGNCTWQQYSTLGFCNTCTNITSRVTSNAEKGLYRLPGGLRLNTQDPITGQAIHYYNASTSINESTFSMEMTFLAIWSKMGSNPDPLPTASKCTLQLCVKNFISAEFKDGQLSEIQSPDLPLFFSRYEVQDGSPAASNLSFSVDRSSWWGYTEWMSSLVSGVYGQYVDSGGTLNVTSDTRDAIFQVLVNERDNMTMQSLFDNVANSLTYAMRAADLTQYVVPSTRPLGNGTTYITTTVVNIHWAWLSFPCTVWALVLLYTVIMMLLSSGTPSWKNSVVATLCHGLDNTAMKEVAGLQIESEMNVRAKGMHVRLVTDDLGTKLSQSGHSSMEMK